MDVTKVYVRNTGQNALTDLSVYVNDEIATYNVTPPSIAAGAVGTITIYSFIPDGATVKVTSPSGFSASKVAHPCEKAVGCWDFDEGSGTVALRFFTVREYGTLTNGPTWTSGRYGGALTFDGSNDYVKVIDDISLRPTNAITIGIVARFNNITNDQILIQKDSIDYESFIPVWSPQNFFISIRFTDSSVFSGYTSVSTGVWYHFTLTYDGNYGRFYKNGVEISNSAIGAKTIKSSSTDLLMGRSASGLYYFNGTIDEVRVYNQAIY
jgi:hypothetical protein